MKRVSKMIKVALLMLAVNMLADKTIFNVVKDQLVGTFLQEKEGKILTILGKFYGEIEEADEFVESAYIDTYGDFEHMV